MNRRTSAFAALVSLSLGNADEALAQIKTSTPVAFSGLVDMYYSYNLNDPTPSQANKASDHTGYSGVDSGQTQWRNFDIRHNQLAVNLVELSFKRSADETSVRVDLDFGDSTDLTHRDPNNNTDEVSKHIGQAIITYSPKTIPGLSFNLGKMATHMGYEVTKAKDNWQYSRSFLYALAIPYWHAGLNVAYAFIPEKLNAGLYVYNGWNTMVDYNRGKTLGLQIAWTLIPGVTLTYNGIGGPEKAGNEKDKKIVHEVNLVATVNDSFALAADFAQGTSDRELSLDGTSTKQAKWSAVTTALKIGMGTHAYLSPRFEAYWDPQAYTTGISQTLHATTLTGGLRHSEDFESRLEARHDQSQAAVFRKGHADKVKTQTTVTYGALYSF